MKTAYPSPLLWCAFACVASPLLSAGTNYVNNGTHTPYALFSGDTLRIANGTYTGPLTAFNTGSVVIVSSSATFKPVHVNNPSGKILNYGVSHFGSLGTYGGFWFENFNLLNVTGDLSLYNGSAQTWNNNVTARIAISGNFSMNNAAFTNLATVTVGGNVSLYASTSNLLNRGVITVTGNFSISNGIVNNQNRIVANDFTAWDGQVTNEGSISPRGDLTFGKGTSYTNRCLLVTQRGFTNYGNFQNNGMMWVGRTATAADHFYNTGTFTNSADAVVRSVKLTNYGTLAGGGGYYVTGESYTSGAVGRTGPTTDTVRVYDLTRTNANSIFDVQYGTVRPNVVYRAFAQPDTAQVNYTGCSSYYRGDLGTLLPVEWNYFQAKLVNNQPSLSWSAGYKPDVRFEVERSYNNLAFTKLTAVSANRTETYTYVDAAAAKEGDLYYRIKAVSTNGTVKYTETRIVKRTVNTSGLLVSPNPVVDAATVTFASATASPVTVTVRTAAGQRIVSKSMSAVAGTNAVSLPEAGRLQPGVYFTEVRRGESVIALGTFVKQ